MLNENIKRARKAAHISQEEVAVRLGVVRQTVSKWEQGLSVPDADLLVKLAEILNVPVGTLLGTTEAEQPALLAQALEEANQVLANQAEQLRRLKLAEEKQGLILFFCFASLLAALTIRNGLLSLILTSGCMLLASAVLYRNLALLTSITTDDQRLGALRATTIFCVIEVVVCIGIAILEETGQLVLNDTQSRLLLAFLVGGMMVFCGAVSPRLPFNRHTGLRLPWTVRDADTWYLAHRILGWISLPMALLFVACVMTVENLTNVIAVIFAGWIGIPGGISLLYYNKKMRGQL